MILTGTVSQGMHPTLHQALKPLRDTSQPLHQGHLKVKYLTRGHRPSLRQHWQPQRKPLQQILQQVKQGQSQGHHPHICPVSCMVNQESLTLLIKVAVLTQQHSLTTVWIADRTRSFNLILMKTGFNKGVRLKEMMGLTSK